MAAAQSPGKCGIIAQIQAQLFAEPMFRKTAVNSSMDVGIIA